MKNLTAAAAATAGKALDDVVPENAYEPVGEPLFCSLGTWLPSLSTAAASLSCSSSPEYERVLVLFFVSRNRSELIATIY